MKVDINHIIVFLLAICLVGCTKERKFEENRLFQLISAEHSGINFTNSIIANDTLNILNYEYLYNGGGVGVGYFNKDSLPDLIFTGNIEPSRLYINEGNLHFKDITVSSGIKTKGHWCTGVSVIDINQDGFDDIYISVGGVGNKSIFPNLLYINNGDLTFTESASEYGLADQGESIQSIFFDYDRDGDLDMYLLTGGGFEHSAINVRPMLDNGTSRNTDRLYRNDYDEDLGHAVFTNVSKDAGINIEGFGLGVSVFDANNDFWPDLYISNDYLSRDLLYINQQDGTFKEDALNYFGHTSHFSMGNDVGDINNDGYLDVVTMDMLPEDLKRRKLMSGVPSYEIFQISVGFGYGHQYMRNMLQLNNGNNSFSEIGQLSGIDKTDWSWAPLLADFDNDGLSDLFVTNGFGKDITDMDFVKFRENSSYKFSDVEELGKSVIDCLYQRPAIKVPNYTFKNKGDLTFEKVTDEWGFSEETISNGAAYADLDLDGDLDLIVNNINQPASIYQNKTRESNPNNSNYLTVQLEGSNSNLTAIGATVEVYKNGNSTIRYNQPVRGFQSSVDKNLFFGLNGYATVDSLKVFWPDGKSSLLKGIDSNQILKIDYSEASNTVDLFGAKLNKPLFLRDSLIRFKHQERPYNDYGYQQLLLHGFSNQGPGMAVGDLNGDGLEDLFIGGSYGFNSTIYFQEKNGDFTQTEIKNSELYEDEGALIFDANGDNLMDLYVTSGGSERYEGHEAYEDRIYYNVNGQFQQGELPKMLTSTSHVVGGDFDKDGDIDLFVGGRVIPGKYPKPP
ncbi:VCBS repeat-containing protein, partial [Aegicerativicinus sediminis]